MEDKTINGRINSNEGNMNSYELVVSNSCKNFVLILFKIEPHPLTINV